MTTGKTLDFVKLMIAHELKLTEWQCEVTASCKDS